MTLRWQEHRVGSSLAHSEQGPEKEKRPEEGITYPQELAPVSYLFQLELTS